MSSALPKQHYTLEEYLGLDKNSEQRYEYQDRPHITQYVRQPHGKWLRSEVEGMDGELRLESLHCRLDLHDVYRRVGFHKPGGGRA